MKEAMAPAARAFIAKSMFPVGPNSSALLDDFLMLAPASLTVQ
jgi:hypothetical protein